MRNIAEKAVVWAADRLGLVVLRRRDFNRAVGTAISLAEYANTSGHLRNKRNGGTKARARVLTDTDMILDRLGRAM